MCIQYFFSCQIVDLHFCALQECQDDQRSQALPSQQWRGTQSLSRAPHQAANQLLPSDGSEMTRRSKVSVWSGFKKPLYSHCTLCPFLSVSRCPYRQLTPVLYFFMLKYSCIFPVAVFQQFCELHGALSAMLLYLEAVHQLTFIDSN